MYRIRTPRMLLRAVHPRDAELMCRTIAGSLEHLRRWMEWAKAEPESLGAKVARLRKIHNSTIRGGSQGFGIFTPDESILLGTIGSHPRIGAGAREIGYWIAESHVRQGYTSEAAAALVKIGFELQRLRRMEIHTDPQNIACIGVARKLRFHHHAIIRQRMLDQTAPPRDTTIWAMTAAQYSSLPRSMMKIEAFDHRGTRLL